jgi:hypothetical protein
LQTEFGIGGGKSRKGFIKGSISEKPGIICAKKQHSSAIATYVIWLENDGGFLTDI